MENASKALVIAAGVLIAIIIISTLLYAATTWGIIPQKKDEIDEKRQLAEFNQEYESYNKNAIYGSDLVSVLNKAMSNNSKNSATYTANYKNTDSMYINVTFKLKYNNIEKVKTTYAEYVNGEKQGEKVPGYDVKEKTDVEFSISPTPYSLSSNKSKIESFINLFNQRIYKQRDYTQWGTDADGTYYIYEEISMPTSEFKTKVFQCTNVEYNTVTGRVCLMQFEERNANEDKEKYLAGTLENDFK